MREPTAANNTSTSAWWHSLVALEPTAANNTSVSLVALATDLLMEKMEKVKKVEKVEKVDMEKVDVEKVDVVARGSRCGETIETNRRSPIIILKDVTFQHLTAI